MYETQIKAGVDLLTEVMPGWQSQIDLGNFNISDGTRCVLGQLFGSYSIGLAKLGIEFEDAHAYGFTVPALTDDELEHADVWQLRTEAWQTLGYEWIVQLTPEDPQVPH